MDQQILRKKLCAQRNRLGYSQEYTGTLLGISQPAYSDIESGKTKFTEKLLKQIKGVEDFEEFDEIELDPPKPEKVSFIQSIANKWPWGKTSLYMVISIMALAGLDYVLRAVPDVARGFGVGTGHNTNTNSIILAVDVILLLVLSIVWFFRIRKWWKAKAKSDKIVL